MSAADIDDAITAELDRAPSAEVAAMSAMLAARPGVMAVLFYGNRLRDAAAGGLMDFYVLTESDAAYHGIGASALANRLLPPTVTLERPSRPGEDGGDATAGGAAKVAVMRLDAFCARMRPESVDTTLWARFAQPALLLHARDGDVRAEVIGAVIAAFRAAAWWASRLAPPGADAATAWGALFTQTYGAELRVEGAGRAGQIVSRAPALYEALHAAWIAGAAVSDAERARARALWARQRRRGKALNLARLAKAAVTFRGGIAYALSKVERHSGRPVELSRWERRAPWLAAPIVLLRLWRERRLR